MRWIQSVRLQRHFMFEGISLGTTLTLVDCCKINSLLAGTLLCYRTWVTTLDIYLNAVNERHIRGHILQDGNSAGLDQVSHAFLRTVLAIEAPFTSILSLFGIAIRDQRYVHDLANLLECRIKLVSDEISASSTIALIIQSYFYSGSCCWSCDSEQRNCDEQGSADA